MIAVPAQLDLFRPIVEVESGDPRTYAERFDLQNPHVMELLARLARRARARTGSARIGFRMVWEMARWMYVRSTRDDSGYRLNNNLQSWYARTLMQRFPDLKDAFQTRERSDGAKVRGRGNAAVIGSRRGDMPSPAAVSHSGSTPVAVERTHKESAAVSNTVALGSYPQ